MGRIGSGVRVSASFQKKTSRRVVSYDTGGGGVTTYEGFILVVDLPMRMRRVSWLNNNICEIANSQAHQLRQQDGRYVIVLSFCVIL